MKNPILQTLANAKSTGNAIKAAGELGNIPSVSKPKLSKFREDYLQGIAEEQQRNTLFRNDTAPASVDINNTLNEYIADNANLKYSQERRNEPGYGDCSTYACKLQSKVYGKNVPDTTRGMIDQGTKTNDIRPGTMSIYDTGDGNRHVLTWLPNGNQIGLGPSGVKEYSNYNYPLIGNYNY